MIPLALDRNSLSKSIAFNLVYIANSKIVLSIFIYVYISFIVVAVSDIFQVLTHFQLNLLSTMKCVAFYKNETQRK